jgi:hypothetical protein
MIELVIMTTLYDMKRMIKINGGRSHGLTGRLSIKYYI